MVRKLLLFFFLFTGLAYAQFGSGAPFPDNILIRNDGVDLDGAGKILDLRDNISATYDSTTSTYHVAAEGGNVSDLTYGVTWDGITTVAPSKNAVYDKIEALILGGGESTAVEDTTTIDLTLTSTTVKADLLEAGAEAILDLQDMQGAVTDSQVPDNITITESDPQVGGVTNDSVCQADGVAVNCNLTKDGSGACAAGSVCTGGHTHGSTEITEVDPTVDTDDEIIAIINNSPSTTIKHEAGGLEADVSAYNGFVKISGGSTSAVTASAGTDITADLEEEVTEGSLADSTIVSADIKDGTIVDADMGNDGLDPDKLVGDTTDNDKIDFAILSETDPQVGGVTLDSICKGDGVAVNCNLTQDGSGACSAGAVCTGGHTHLGVNETYGVGWDSDTATPEKDDVYDWGHVFDTDDDGKVNVLDLVDGIVTTNASGIVSTTSVILPINGGIGFSGVTDDTIILANGSNWVSTAVNECSGANQALSYNSTTNVIGCITISEADPQVGGVTNDSICQADGVAVNCNLTKDASGSCGAGNVCTGGHTHPTTEVSGVNAGSDLTADLEEETHASEHAVGAADTVFPADPNADRVLQWDDDPGTLAWVESGGAETDPQVGGVTSDSVCMADGVAIQCNITKDASGSCGANNVCMGGHTHPTTEISGVNAGTDLTADLEEEVTEGSLADSTVVSADIKDGTIAGGDLATNIAITSTGVQDFGGASSVEIPNAAAPTLDATGEIGVDTSDVGQLIAVSGDSTTLIIVPGTYFGGFTIENLAAADDNIPIPGYPWPVTIKKFWCSCVGTCTTSATLSFEDAAANSMTTTGTITCGTGTSAPAYSDVTANGSLTAREPWQFDVTNTPNPETDEYAIGWSYSIDRQ